MAKTFKKFAIGALFAAVIGYIAGILTAPKSGKETREDLKNATVTGIAEAEKRLKQLHTQMNDALKEAQALTESLKGVAKKDLDEATKVVKTVKEKVRDVLSAVHEGTVDDKELQKAISDASKALDHLKKFLKKPVA